MAEERSEFESTENTIARLIVSVNGLLLNFWDTIDLNHTPTGCWVYLNLYVTATKAAGGDEYTHEQRFTWFEDGGYPVDIIDRMLDVVEAALTGVESMMAVSSYDSIISAQCLTGMVVPFADD